MSDDQKQALAIRSTATLVQSMDDVARVAKMFAASGYFDDAKDAAQVGVKIMAGRELGFEPFASVNGVHLIKGKPSIGANLMAAAVKGSGKYDYRVREISNDTCRIEFFEGGESLGVSEFTITDAKAAGTQNLQKFARNMLFARAMSNGIRWYTPDVFMGSSVYTPEELGASVDGEGEVIDVASRPEKPQEPREEPAPEPDGESPAEAAEGQGAAAADDDGEFPPDAPESVTEATLTEAEGARLTEALNERGVDKILKFASDVTGRKVKRMTDLTTGEAAAVFRKADGGDPDEGEAA